jgi:uncharacterized cupin superfamily protein
MTGLSAASMLSTTGTASERGRRVSESVNLFEVASQGRSGRPEGYRAASVMLGPLLGASALGASVYDLAPGQSICPYHYEHGREEWLVVVRGRPTLRHPEGEEQLEPWDTVAFPEGPEGAHKVTNHSDGAVRVVMPSTKGQPALSVYPDSGKVAIRPLGKLFRLADEVDYWEGELT